MAATVTTTVARLILGHLLIGLLMAVTAINMVARFILGHHSIWLPLMAVTVTTMVTRLIPGHHSMYLLMVVTVTTMVAKIMPGHFTPVKKSIPTTYCILFDKGDWWRKFCWDPYGNYLILTLITPYFLEMSWRCLLIEVHKGSPWVDPAWRLNSQPPVWPWADLPNQTLKLSQW